MIAAAVKIGAMPGMPDIDGSATPVDAAAFAAAMQLAVVGPPAVPVPVPVAKGPALPSPDDGDEPQDIVPDGADASSDEGDADLIGDQTPRRRARPDDGPVPDVAAIVAPVAPAPSIAPNATTAPATEGDAIGAAPMLAARAGSRAESRATAPVAARHGDRAQVQARYAVAAAADPVVPATTAPPAMPAPAPVVRGALPPTEAASPPSDAPALPITAPVRQRVRDAAPADPRPMTQGAPALIDPAAPIAEPRSAATSRPAPAPITDQLAVEADAPVAVRAAPDAVISARTAAPEAAAVSAPQPAAAKPAARGEAPDDVPVSRTAGPDPAIAATPVEVAVAGIDAPVGEAPRAPAIAAPLVEASPMTSAPAETVPAVATSSSATPADRDRAVESDTRNDPDPVQTAPARAAVASQRAASPAVQVPFAQAAGPARVAAPSPSDTAAPIPEVVVATTAPLGVAAAVVQTPSPAAVPPAPTDAAPILAALVDVAATPVAAARVATSVGALAARSGVTMTRVVREPAASGRSARTKPEPFVVAHAVRAEPTAVDPALLRDTATPAIARTPAEIAAAPVDRAVDRQLDLAIGNQWLDQLATDIARTGAGDAPMRFTLAPQMLGKMTVELNQAVGGAEIRIATETEAARDIIADARPGLIAEVRAQGIRVSDAQVSVVAQSNAAAANAANGSSGGNHVFTGSGVGGNGGGAAGQSMGQGGFGGQRHPTPDQPSHPTRGAEPRGHRRDAGDARDLYA